MQALMLDALCRRLAETLGEGWRIYADQTPRQGTRTPCCVVESCELSQTPYLAGRKRLCARFEVLCLAEESRTRPERAELAQALLFALETISPAGAGAVRGVNLRARADGEGWRISAEYRVFVNVAPQTATPEARMESLEQRMLLGLPEAPAP